MFNQAKFQRIDFVIIFQTYLNAPVSFTFNKLIKRHLKAAGGHQFSDHMDNDLICINACDSDKLLPILPPGQ